MSVLFFGVSSDTRPGLLTMKKPPFQGLLCVRRCVHLRGSEANPGAA